MYGFIFGLFSLALLFFYGMVHTFYFVRKLKNQVDDKRKYIRYGSLLGIYGSISCILAILVYYYGVG